MALLRRGDLSVIEVCFAVGCASLGTFSSRFTELVGVPPSLYRRQAGASQPMRLPTSTDAALARRASGNARLGVSPREHWGVARGAVKTAD